MVHPVCQALPCQASDPVRVAAAVTLLLDTYVAARLFMDDEGRKARDREPMLGQLFDGAEEGILELVAGVFGVAKAEALPTALAWCDEVRASGLVGGGTTPAGPALLRVLT